MSPNQSTRTNDVRTMYIGDRIRHHSQMNGLTGELFKLAADEIDRLRAEVKRLEDDVAFARRSTGRLLGGSNP